MNLFDILFKTGALNDVLPTNRYGEIRQDAGETYALAAQLKQLEEKIYQKKFPDLIARDLAPKLSLKDDGSTSFSYQMVEGFGKAADVREDAQDLPSVDLLVKEFPTSLQTVGASFNLGIDELKAAALGYSIESEKGVAVRRAIETRIDEILATGISDRGILGMLNNGYVNLITPITGSWSEATAANLIIADIRKLITGVTTQSKRAFSANKLIMPSAKYEFLSKLRSESSDLTVLESIAKSFPGIEIKPWERADTAGASSVARMMAGDFANGEIGAAIPREMTMEAPQFVGLSKKVPCHAKCGGTQIKYPIAFAYMDGV